MTLEMIKGGGEPLQHYLLKVFSNILEEAKTPEDWSKLIIDLMHKKGDRTLPCSYCAIALTCATGKIFIRILQMRIAPKVEEKQFGFRPGRSNTDAIFIKRQLTEKAKDHQQDTYIHFVDFKSAFDTM